MVVIICGGYLEIYNKDVAFSVNKHNDLYKNMCLNSLRLFVICVIVLKLCLSFHILLTININV